MDKLLAAALMLASCGIETVPSLPPDESDFPEYVRGVELLEEQGIHVLPFRVHLVDEPIELPCCGLVAGYVESYSPGVVVVVSDPCLGSTALLHELTHLALNAEGQRDRGHKLTPYWDAVRAANAIWRAEECL